MKVYGNLVDHNKAVILPVELDLSASERRELKSFDFVELTEKVSNVYYFQYSLKEIVEIDKLIKGEAYVK